MTTEKRQNTSVSKPSLDHHPVGSDQKAKGVQSATGNLPAIGNQPTTSGKTPPLGQPVVSTPASGFSTSSEQPNTSSQTLQLEKPSHSSTQTKPLLQPPPVTPSSSSPTLPGHQPSISEQVMTGNQRGEPTIDRNVTTQIGQMIQNLRHKLTDRLPKGALSLSGHTHASPPSRDYLARMILALGDPEHPDHANSIEVLVESGIASIPLLKDGLKPDLPWLTAYRSAEALGRIGDGRATGALIQALRHPNSNVRWSAVRALAQIGDLRALFELRRVAHEDTGRTSWGESVGGAAQSALDQIQSQSMWSQALELIKTSVTSVLMILSLILAFSVISTLRTELQHFGKATPGKTLSIIRTLPPTATASAGKRLGPQEAGSALLLPNPTQEITQIITPTPLPSPTTRKEPITGKVLSSANVRPLPSVQYDPVGTVTQGDEIIFVGMSADGMWYYIRLGERHADSSSIKGDDGSDAGWIHRELVSPPKGDVPIKEPKSSTKTPTPTKESDESP